MPMPLKGLTSKFLLRMHPSERELIERVVQVHADFDIKISINDAVRILIRRGSEVQPITLEQVRSAMAKHWEGCEYCTERHIGCPDGLWLKGAHDRLAPPAAAPKRAPAARKRLLPPPPGFDRKTST